MIDPYMTRYRWMRWTVWMPPFVLAFWAWAATPLARAPATALGEKILSFAIGFAFVCTVALWVQGIGAAGRGLRRLLFLGALAASIASAVDLGNGLAAGLNGAPRPAEGWGDFARWLLVTGGMGLVLHRIERFRAREAQREHTLREAQDAALRSRLAPHFVFNALATLKAQIARDPGAAEATADRLAALFRQVLAAADRRTVPLREELAFVEDYLGLERARLGGRLRVTVEVPEELEGAMVPPLALQALVENAVKHGVAPREAGGEIRIFARAEPEHRPRPTLLVGVESPLAPGAAIGSDPGTGTGLAALRGRLARPEDLELEEGDGRFRARFRWALA
jgi:two-component sensor histidine kinase